MAFPEVHVIAGPNGAGKSLFAHDYLAAGLEYVNADDIARDLPPELEAGRAVAAGKAALRRESALEARRASFALETTLAGSSLSARLRRMQAAGYRLFLYYLWLRQPELAVSRVALRVSQGGHDIPEPVIRRRYAKGLTLFLDRYLPLADMCYVYDNSGSSLPQLIAYQPSPGDFRVVDDPAWNALRRKAHDAR